MVAAAAMAAMIEAVGATAGMAESAVVATAVASVAAVAVEAAVIIQKDLIILPNGSSCPYDNNGGGDDCGCDGNGGNGGGGGGNDGGVGSPQGTDHDEIVLLKHWVRQHHNTTVHQLLCFPFAWHQPSSVPGKRI